jgi:hypothetical protein
MQACSTEGASVSSSGGGRVIVSGISGDGWQDIADLTWPAMEAYGRTYGIPFASYCGNGKFSRPEAWRKLIYVADAFAGTDVDEVLWLDADIAIVDSTKNIFDEVPRCVPLAMAFLDGSPPHWNTGVWLLRKPCLPILVEAAMRDHCISHRWWEQQAVIEIIEEFNVPTHRLGEEWNHWVDSPKDISPRFRHACGPVDKISLLRSWLNK